MRWKALQFLGKLDTNNKQTFGFRSAKCPPTVDEFGSFKTDLQEMISNIKFRPIRNKFLSKLNEDVKTIKNTSELLINADKSSNIYKMTKEDYKKHLENNITKTYKKSNRSKIKAINRDAKKIAKKLEIDDRVEKLQEAEAFIKIKDHKDGFPHTLSFTYPYPYAPYPYLLTNIDNDQLSIIMQSRKTLFYNDEPWVKKTGDKDFDVTMGCNDGAELCETVGIYMLNKLSNIINRENIVLYCDDGLGICQNMSKTEVEQLNKKIVKIFKESGLSITIECNLKSVDFLDVTFDLVNNTYKPY